MNIYIIKINQIWLKYIYVDTQHYVKDISP